MMPVSDWIKLQWEKALDEMPPVHFKEAYHGKDGSWKKGLVGDWRRGSLPGAYQYASKVVSGEGERGAWLRYLQDHSSKSKQEQIAEDQGRHWGVFGKKLMRCIDPETTVDMSRRDRFRFDRVYRRLRTPQKRKEGVVFGRCLAYSPRAIPQYGQAVFYSRIETVLRIVEWAKSERLDHPDTPKD